MVPIIASISCKKSPMSEYTNIERDKMLQVGNSLRQSALLPWQPDSIVPNTRMGGGISFSRYDLPAREDILDQLLNLGTKRVSTSLPEGEEPIDWDWPEDEFPEEYDWFIDGLNDNGVVAEYVIHFWDKAGHAMGNTLSTPRFQTAEQVEDFIAYLRLIVGHYKGRIQYYTIWSEPDACGGSGIKCIEPDDYIDLIRQAVPVIHEEDPLAKVSIAPVVLYYAHDYLFTLLRSDIMPMVDMIQWHGIYDVLPNSSYYGDYYYEYYTILEEIKQVASAHGFSGEFWGSEITWASEEFPNGQPPDHTRRKVKTDKEAAKYYSRSILMHLGMDVGFNHSGFANPGSPWSYPAIRNLYAVMAGAKPTSFAMNVENEPPKTSNFAFTLPGDNLLIAFWIDDVAAFQDPGVITKLTFPGLSAQDVEGINVLYGFRQ